MRCRPDIRYRVYTNFSDRFSYITCTERTYAVIHVRNINRDGRRQYDRKRIVPGRYTRDSFEVVSIQFFPSNIKSVAVYMPTTPVSYIYIRYRVGGRLSANKSIRKIYKNRAVNMNWTCVCIGVLNIFFMQTAFARSRQIFGVCRVKLFKIPYDIILLPSSRTASLRRWEQP